MEVLINILCGAMILLSIFLVAAVLMQSGKDSHLSGTISGSAETFSVIFAEWNITPACES